MKKMIENLREKPDHVKQLFALFGSLAITGIIAIFWVLGMVYGGLGLTNNSTVAGANDGDDPSSLTVIKTQLSDAAKSAGDQMANVGSSFGSSGSDSSASDQAQGADDTTSVDSSADTNQ